MLSLTKRMKDRKSDAIFFLLIWTMLLESPEMSWHTCNADGGKSEKIGSTDFSTFDCKSFFAGSTYAFSNYTFSYAQQELRVLDFCKPVYFSAYPDASCGGGLNATLSFSWSILKETGVKGR